MGARMVGHGLVQGQRNRMMTMTWEIKIVKQALVPEFDVTFPAQARLCKGLQNHLAIDCYVCQ
jgi:hypothetical protein